MLISATNCPVGYHYQTGDKVGNPTEIENKMAKGMEECGKRCNNINLCSSIEWSDSEKLCVLLTAKYTDGPKWKDYRFCSKVKGNYRKSYYEKYNPNNIFYLAFMFITKLVQQLS